MEDWQEHRKLCSHGQPLPSAVNRSLCTDSDAGGSSAGPDGEAAAQESLVVNTASAPLPPGVQMKGKMARKPLATATYQDVRDFHPHEVVEWLECIGFLERFDESPRVLQALEECMLNGRALLELAATPNGLEKCLPIGPAVDLNMIIRGLRSDHGWFVLVDTMNLC